MSDYFEDNYGLDLRKAIKDAIDVKGFECEDENTIVFYSEDGDITIDFSDNTVNYDGDWIDFDECKKSAIALARTEYDKHHQVRIAQEAELNRMPDSYADAFTRIAAKADNSSSYKDSKPRFGAEGPFQLTYKQLSEGPDRFYTYNFLTRVLIVSTSSAESGSAVVPFSSLDRETLEHMRQKLIDLGGKPPPLPLTDAERFNIPKLRAKGPDNV